MLRNLLSRLSVVLLASIVAMIPRGQLEAQSKPVIGSPNVAVADPPVPTPGTKPCTVQLFPTENFGARGADTRMDAVPHAFNYQPPAGCKGSWAKVVLETNFSVDPGHQYDRTASIWLKGVNLYFGTTEEPSPNFGASWQIERDLTDYSSLLRRPGKGVALINNWVDSVRGSYIHASARLLFYPGDARFPAPRTPDAVYPLNSPDNLPANLQSGESQLVRKITFPRNTTRVYMDVFAQSQFHDEFWYSCLPNKYIEQTTAFAMKRTYKGAPKHPIACGGGSYREVEVSIDGQPAGLAPIYPWVFTGGIDPFLWRPTPAVQTLNFVPYRLDLTPFAGLLSDGSPHSVSVRVLGSHHYFSVAAALLVYRDLRAKRTGGAVTLNTLKGASLKPAVTSTLSNSQSGVNGDVLTRAKQSYVIEGYVNTPAGRVRNGVEESLRFANTQKFTTIGPHSTRDVIEQVTNTSGSSSSAGGSSKDRKFQRSLNYSLTVNTLRQTGPNHRSTHTVHLQQIFDMHIDQFQAGLPTYHASVRNLRTTADQVTFNFKGGHVTLSGSRDQSSTQDFSFTDSLGDCYHAELKASGGKVSSLTRGQGCSASSKPMHWFVHPTGSPESFGWRANSQH